MQKLTQIVIVFGIVMQFSTSYSAPLCEIDEYWQSVLGMCYPCQSICVPLTRKDCQRLCWKRCPFTFDLENVRWETPIIETQVVILSETDCNYSGYIISLLPKRTSTEASRSSTSKQIIKKSNQLATPANKPFDLANSHTSTDAVQHPKVKAKADKVTIITCGVLLFLSALVALVYCFRHKMCTSVKALFERNRPTVRAQEEEGTQEETVALREL